MTIKIKIDNFRKIQQADFEISPITLLVGENENGKSSIAMAVSMVATGNILPKGMYKKDVNQLIHDGARESKISICRNGLATEVIYPACEHNQHAEGKDATLEDVIAGQAELQSFHVSDFAAGLGDIFELNNSEKTAYLINLLKAAPTESDLKTALSADTHFLIPEIWTQITQSGWDATYDIVKKEEIEFIGRWKQITGELKWNIDTANKWRPAEWEQSLEQGNLEDLQSDFNNSEKVIEEALKSEGAADFDKSRLEDIIAGKTELQEELTKKETEVRNIRIEIDAVINRCDNLPSPDDIGIPCPVCDAALIIVSKEEGYVCTEYLEDATEEKENREQDKDILYIEINRLKNKDHDINKQIYNIKENLTKIENAEIELQKANEAKNVNNITTEEAKTQSINIKLQLDNFIKVQQASDLYKKVIIKRELSSALSQNGVRKTKLQDEITKFNNDILKPLCDKLNWEAVIIDNDLNIWRGRRAYKLLSRSARYITRVILQVGLAMTDKSELLIIDDLDIITNDQNKTWLLEMIASSNIPALICMAIRPNENAPSIQGTTYLVKNGTMELVEEYGAKND